MKKDLTIYVVTHKKESYIPSDSLYTPIQVGRALNPELDPDYLNDATGDNISHLNENFCELTALYWIWKNKTDTSKNIGVVHYRRYFDFSSIDKKLSIAYFKDLRNRNDIDKKYKDEILEVLNKYDIILPRPSVMAVSLRRQYEQIHIIEDLSVVENAVRTLFPEMSQTWNNVMERNYYSPFNMFITSSELFDDYCEWLFKILNHVKEEIKISDDPYQKRVFGFLAERLFNVWIEHRKLKVKYLPVLTIGIENHSTTSQVLRRFRANIIYRFNRKRVK